MLKLTRIVVHLIDGSDARNDGKDAINDGKDAINDGKDARNDARKDVRKDGGIASKTL